MLASVRKTGTKPRDWSGRLRFYKRLAVQTERTSSISGHLLGYPDIWILREL